MNVVVVANQKGGVGKTTTAHFLAGYLKSKEKKVLLIDLDPQASLTRLFDIKEIKSSSADIFTNEVKILKVNKFLDLIPSSQDLNQVNNSKIIAKEFKLLRYLNKIKKDYDFIVIDTNPSLNDLLTSAIITSDVIAIPVATKFLDFDGTVEFIVNIVEILQGYDHKIKKCVAIPTLFKKIGVSHNEYLVNMAFAIPDFLEDLLENIPREKQFGYFVTPPISDRVIISEAAEKKKFILEYINETKKNKDLILTLKQIAKDITDV